jgi:small subunit ribosomal protein S3Ae
MNHFPRIVFLWFSADPFSKKDWYDVKAPANFDVRNIGRTLVTRTTGTSNETIFAKEFFMNYFYLEIASDALKGRVFEASLGDLIKLDDEDSHRKFKLICEDVQGRHCLTTFHGMDMTTDRLRMLVKKWQVNNKQL